ncbi:DUF3310 domain-containing protein [Alkalihalobacillus sp. LMS6]|uniref:DUF3310 domain-containing protein n=1 Tax=Alkalihalobacillus sp. LMS6 TaxID=2924034 RepID=UPI0020D1EF6B|nr:DUF3310 domain-containing protein [Alkalihalobacillus sp. LMS6]UTR05413.1 DUF3310 domain-containing protein [Alkalihalobacillus sp. LMS6]
MTNSKKPSHYESKIDPLTYMKANMSQANYEGFLIGNVIKYVTRYQKKNGLEDLKKAADYLNKAIEMYEEQDPNSIMKSIQETYGSPDNETDKLWGF